jgi:hypothetical protein
MLVVIFSIHSPGELKLAHVIEASDAQRAGASLVESGGKKTNNDQNNRKNSQQLQKCKSRATARRPAGLLNA